jgi:hypothetical protein
MSKRQTTTTKTDGSNVESYVSFLDDFMGDEEAFRRFTNWVLSLTVELSRTLLLCVPLLLLQFSQYLACAFSQHPNAYRLTKFWSRF